MVSSWLPVPGSPSWVPETAPTPAGLSAHVLLGELV